LDDTLYLDTIAPSTVSSFTKGTSTIDISGDVFSLSSSGVLSFSSAAAAVPEPSTYALMFLGALVLIWQTSRRKSNSI
jgi:hypothetical protein